jgi:hypothetical protein
MFAQNFGDSIFIKQTLLSLKEQTGPDSIIVGDLNTPFSLVDRTSRSKKSTKIF